MNATPAVHDSDWPLGSHLQQSYELHPAFRFDAPAWQVDFDQLTTFNDAYALLSTHASRLDPRQRGKCRAQAVRSLAAVFGHFVSQAADRLEVQFATELHSQCLRLFDEELVLYSWKPISGALHFGAAAAQSHLLDLQRQHYYFGALPAACVQDMLAIGAADLRHLRETARRGRLQREDLSVNTGPTVRRIVGLLNREFRAQGALDALSAYMNRRMSVTGVALELSVPQATWWGGWHTSLTRPPRTLYAHLDESIVYPKSIVYLSNVDSAAGPTSCYPGAFAALALNPLQALVGRVVAGVGNSANSPLCDYYVKPYHQSMASERFRRHFMRLPAEVRFNSHFGWDVLPESEAERTLCEHERVMTGHAGTFIVFDGARLLHRGGLLQSGERIALQVVFSHVGLPERIWRKVRRWLP